MEVTTKRVALGDIQDPELNRANIIAQAAMCKPGQKIRGILRLPVAGAVAPKEPEPELSLSALLNDVSLNIPQRVVDIDANQKRSIFLVPEYVNDIYDHLYQLEEQHPIVKDHMRGQMDLTPQMRAMLIDWLNAIHLQFRLVQETFQLTVSIIDRYLQVFGDTHRSCFQLVGITALYIATKFEELFPPPITDLVYISDNTYTAREIRQMELHILEAIDCNLSRPLPIQFLRRYSKAAYVKDRHHSMAKYFIDLAALDYDLASYRPSEIAAAALFLSLNVLNGHYLLGKGFDDRHWSPTLAFYSRYSAAHLRPISWQMAKLAREAPQAKLGSVYTKFKMGKFHEIALRHELSGPLLDAIVDL